MLFDGQKPILAIEILSNKLTPPKNMAGPIPIYMIYRKIILNYNNGKGKEYELKRAENINQILFLAQKDYEKEYANSLSEQPKFTLDWYDELINYYKNLIEADLDDNIQIEKIIELEKSVLEFVESNIKKIEDLGNKREDIRALYPDFTERLNKEVELAENATIN